MAKYSLSKTKPNKSEKRHPSFYHIEFAKAGLGVSGGETWMVSIIKKLSEEGYKNVLLTTDNGMRAYQELGLIDGVDVEYRVINSYETEKKVPLIISYVTRTFQAIKLVRTLSPLNSDYIISHSDFFPNTVPFFIASKKVAHSHRVCLMHLVAPKLFRGFEQHFKGGFKIPSIRFIHHKLNQLLCFSILRRRAALILTNSVDNATQLKIHCPKNKVINLRYFAAASVHKPAKAPTRDIDVVWVGRFQHLKGLLDMAEIVNEVKKRVPSVKVTIVGGGEESIEKRFRQLVDDLGLKRNVTMAGFLTGSEKDKIISRAKLFAMTSHFESYSIVILESMLLETPIVAYDLPCYGQYSGGIAVVPMFDKKKFAHSLSNLLINKSSYQKLQRNMNKKAKNFTWDNTIKEFIGALGIK